MGSGGRAMSGSSTAADRLPGGSEESRASTPPLVSVVIGAYSRETFVAGAVQSVLDQTLDRDRIEIVVTKNFRSEPVDEFLARKGAISILDSDPRIGAWLMRAIRRTSAPLIAFLDDDDLFDPDRLQHVIEVFRAHPDLGYYRNRVSVIGPDGFPIPRKAWAPNEVDPVFDETGPLHVGADGKVAAFPTIRRTYAYFNSSTIVIRRDVLTEEMAARFEQYQSPDPFLFVAGIASPFELYLDDRRTTAYRHHGTNLSAQTSTLRHGLEDSRRLAQLCQDLGFAEYAAWFDARSREIDKRLLVGTIMARVASHGTRLEVASAARAYLRFLGDHPGLRRLDLETWAAELYAATHLFFPRAADRMFRLRTERRSAERMGQA